MGELRDRMQGDMVLRGLRETTQRAYLDCAQKFAAYYRRSPAELGAKEIREYLLYLLEERELRPSSIGVHIGALKFLYKVTLDRAQDVTGLVCPKRRQRLPEVLTPGEVELLLTAVRWVKHRAAILVAYGAGLRSAEVCRLQISDIDSQQMLIHVRDGKGGKDRYTLLSESLLKVLRDYYRACRPTPPFLFSGDTPGLPMAPKSFAGILRRAAWRCGLTKRVSPHVLRHSFATRLLEDGVDLPTMQQLLGHSSIRTSARYVRVSTAHLKKVVSPVEKIRIPGVERHP